MTATLPTISFFIAVCISSVASLLYRVNTYNPTPAQQAQLELTLKGSGFPMGSPDSATADGRRSSNISLMRSTRGSGCLGVVRLSIIVIIIIIIIIRLPLPNLRVLDSDQRLLQGDSNELLRQTGQDLRGAPVNPSWLP